jgi:L-threonylcarbamoyladenylate synthase
MKVYNSLTDPQVVAALQAGAVGVLPTDTLYGLVCRAADKAAVTRLYTLKSRDHKPGTLIAANIDQLVELGIPRRYLTPVQQFWPGAVSVETPHHVDYLTQSTGRQGIRIPDHPELLALLARTGPLQTTSANQPGEPPATVIADAQKYFGDSVDFYVDGGDLSDRLPSTIIRVIDDAIEVIRQGAVKIDED